MSHAQRLRARLCLRAVLPLLEVVIHEDQGARSLAHSLQGAAVHVASLEGQGAWLVFEGSEVSVGGERSARSKDLELHFESDRRLADFFAGKLAVPGLGALRSPRKLAALLRLLLRLGVLEPGRRVAPGEGPLYVKLIFRLLTRALAELHEGGHEEMVALARASPDRVYQWRVLETGEGAWLRMERGRVQAGHGLFEGRAPFVETLFPTTEAACRVLSTPSSSMERAIAGDVRHEGSPDYARKISVLAQKMDALLRGV